MAEAFTEDLNRLASIINKIVSGRLTQEREVVGLILGIQTTRTWLNFNAHCISSVSQFGCQLGPESINKMLSPTGRF